jgi:cold shock CspA family protein
VTCAFPGVAAMMGRITRLIDMQQFGTIAGDDGEEYPFQERSLVGVRFEQLSLGAAVTFDVDSRTGTKRRAINVRAIGPSRK